LVDSTGRAYGSDNPVVFPPVPLVVPDQQVVVPEEHLLHRAHADLSVAVPLRAPEYADEVAFDEHVDISRVTQIGADAFYRFRAHVGWLLQSNGADDEFAQLFHSTQHEFTAERCSDSLIPANREKNRYANVLPYDFNRVRLSVPRFAVDADAIAAAPRAPADDPDDDGDYINGSYLLPDFDEKEAATRPADFAAVASRSCPYIATQGPKPNTIGAFWRMVWRQRTACIVMLGQPIENNVAKFSQYWPEHDHDLLEVDEFQLKAQRTVDHGEYVKRVYAFTNTIVGEVRYVLHFLFTSFPDHGTPGTTAGFLHLIEMVELETQRAHARYVAASLLPPASLPPPAIVHCSAGLGRTGVYCTIAMTLRKMAEARADALALYDTMMALRRQRAGMMQTRDQLLFCYLSILDCATPLFTNTRYEALPYYHADVHTDADAERLLAGAEQGAYLFRPATQPQHVTLSVRTPPSADADADEPTCAHMLVQCQPNGFVLRGSQVLYLSLEELVCGEADLCRRAITRVV
jgi:protein tyrosine phosphatase